MITVFMKQDVLNLLEEIGTYDEAPQKKDMVLEFIDNPLTAVVKYDANNNADICVYKRDEEQSKTVLQHHGWTKGEDLDGDRGDFDTIAIAVGTADIVNNYLLAKGMIEECLKLNEQQGVLLEVSGNDIVGKIVSGDERPKLICKTKLGATEMCSPK